VSHGPFEWTEFEASDFESPAALEALTERPWYVLPQPAGEMSRDALSSRPNGSSLEQGGSHGRRAGARWSVRPLGGPRC
jgi:hypothetical protein